MTFTMALPGQILDEVVVDSLYHESEAPPSPTAFTPMSHFAAPRRVEEPSINVENQSQPKAVYPRTPLRSTSKAKLIVRPPQTPMAQIKYSEETSLALEKAKSQLKGIQGKKAAYEAKSAELLHLLSSSAPKSISPVDHFETDDLPGLNDSDEVVDVNAPLTSEAVRACFVHTFNADKSSQPAFTADQVQLLCWRQKPSIEEIHRELSKLEGDGLVVRFELFGRRYWRRK
jgi:hypothetical protein